MIASFVFGNIVEISSWLFFKYLCRGKLSGIENLPQGPFILVSNHVSYADWLILYSVFKRVLKRRISFLAKKRLFQPIAWRLLMQHSGAIYLDQDKVDKQTLKNIYSTLSDQNIVGIFPEGKRSESGKLIKARDGVAKLALLAKVPVVPVGLNGFYEILPKGKKIPKICRCSIDIGMPMFFKKSKSSSDLTSITRQIMCEVARLTHQEYSF